MTEAQALHECVEWLWGQRVKIGPELQLHESVSSPQLVSTMNIVCAENLAVYIQLDKPDHQMVF